MSMLITTPTGHIGSRITERLMKSGADATLFARKPDALDGAVRAHFAVHQGDLEDPGSLRSALDGTDTLFFLIPPKYDADDWRAWQRDIARNTVEALAATGTDRVVFLSSGGAQRDDLGPVSGLGEAEDMLNDAIPHVVHLRPGYFMENLMAFIEPVHEQGAIFGAYAPDTLIPFVATRDIGDVAAEWLTDDAWTGHHVVGIHGPKDITMTDAARVIGDVIGKDVHYQQVPPEAVAQSFREMGASDSVAENYREMVAGMETYGLDYKAEPRTAETTTPTTLETFVREVFKPAYEGYAQQAA